MVCTDIHHPCFKEPHFCKKGESGFNYIFTIQINHWITRLIDNEIVSVGDPNSYIPIGHPYLSNCI